MWIFFFLLGKQAFMNYFYMVALRCCWPWRRRPEQRTARMRSDNRRSGAPLSGRAAPVVSESHDE